MKYFYIIIFIALVILFATSLYLLPRNISISQIYCSDQFGDCSESMMKSLQVVVGKDLNDSRETLNGVLGFNTLISDYSVDFRFPDTLVVNVVRRKPRFALSDGSELLAIVDGSGVVVGYENETLLPTVNVDSTLAEVGKKVSDSDLFALNLVLGVRSIDGVGKAQVRDGALIVRLRDGMTAIFPLEGETDVLLGSLVMVLSKLESDDELRTKTSNIDLRFENPVLR